MRSRGHRPDHPLVGQDYPGGQPETQILVASSAEARQPGFLCQARRGGGDGG
jgi:hypothetical protein